MNQIDFNAETMNVLYNLCQARGAASHRRVRSMGRDNDHPWHGVFLIASIDCSAQGWNVVFNRGAVV
jgi:hypothetical protein